MTNVRSTEIEFVLKAKEGVKAKSDKGLVDPRIFSGEQKLLGILDKQTSLWSVKYSSAGLVPPPLQQRWTSYTKMCDFVKNYFDNRDIEIVKVID